MTISLVAVDSSNTARSSRRSESPGRSLGVALPPTNQYRSGKSSAAVGLVALNRLGAHEYAFTVRRVQREFGAVAVPVTPVAVLGVDRAVYGCVLAPRGIPSGSNRTHTGSRDPAPSRCRTCPHPRAAAERRVSPAERHPLPGLAGRSTIPPHRRMRSAIEGLFDPLRSAVDAGMTADTCTAACLPAPAPRRPYDRARSRGPIPPALSPWTKPAFHAPTPSRTLPARSPTPGPRWTWCRRPAAATRPPSTRSSPVTRRGCAAGPTAGCRAPRAARWRPRTWCRTP